MRVSIARLGEWGKIGYFRRGAVRYTVSPYVLNPFSNMLESRLPNTIRRIAYQVPFVMPAIIYGVVCYTYIKNEAYKMTRKNPADYENEVFDDE